VWEPLESILDDISNCLAAKLYYPALVVSLTVPEVCAGLSLTKDVNVTSAHYKVWCEKYLLGGIDPLDVYRLRGGVIHKGRARGHPHDRINRPVFTVPETGIEMWGINLVADEEKVLMLDLPKFCGFMSDGARKWMLDHENDALVQTQLPDLVRFRPNGLDGLLLTVGLPIVA
jgi:hypothetical protein